MSFYTELYKDKLGLRNVCQALYSHIRIMLDFSTISWQFCVSHFM